MDGLQIGLLLSLAGAGLSVTLIVLFMMNGGND